MDTTTKTREYITLGNNLRREQKPLEAIKAYQQAHDLAPDNPIVYALLGTVQKQKGDLLSAISNLQKAIDIAPQSPAWFYRSLGGALQQQGNNEEAIIAYYQAIETDSETPFWVYQSLGNVLSQQQRWDEAITAYQQAKELQPDNEEIDRKLEQLQLEKTKETQVSEANESKNPYYDLGKKQAQQGKWQEAIVSYRQAIELQKDDFKLYEHLAEALVKQGRIDDGRMVYQRSLELNPNRPNQDTDKLFEKYFADESIATQTNIEPSASHYISQGNNLKSEQKLSEAMAAYQQALNIEPDNPKVYALLGTVQKQQGDLSAAVSNLQKAIDINPQPPAWFYASLGATQQQLGQYEKAKQAFDRAIKIEPQQPTWVYMSLASVEQNLGNHLEAITAYQTAIKIEPQQPYGVYSNLGYLLNQQKKFDQGIAAFQKAMEINPQNSSALYHKIGNILEQQGKPSEAAAAYEQADIERTTNNVNVLLSFLRKYVCPDDSEIINIDILDNGCEPTGMQLSVIAEHNQGRVVGTNVCQGFPEQTLKHKRSNTEFYRMDGQNLTFADNSFDVVMSFNVLEHVPNPEQYLRECCRVLRPGGFGYFSWNPIWAGANGHHMNPNMVRKHAERLGIKPLPNYALDGETIPFWGHLLLTSEEMFSLLVNEKKYAPSLAEWMVDYIYKKDHLNRWFWQDFLSAFQKQSWNLVEIKEIKWDKVYLPQDALDRLVQKYKTKNNFSISGAIIVAQKL